MIRTERNRIPLPIPYGWYCVEYSDELANSEVKPVRYFAQDLVLYRTDAGKAHLSEAYCPHLGAHLGHGGRVEKNNLVCPFHGWQFDGEGNVDSVPYATNIPPKAKDKQCLKTLPVVEQNGIIWAWYHPDNVAPLFDVEDYQEISSGEWTAFEKNEWIIHTHIQETGENAVDVAHFPTVHKLGDISQRPEVSFDGHKRESWLHLDFEPLEKDKEGYVESVLYTCNIGPGQTWTRNKGMAEVLMIGLPTPIEHDKLILRFACSVPKAKAESQKVISQLILENAAMQVQEDIPIWENKVYLENPVLCDGDGPIAQYRKWMKQFYNFTQEN